jgi:ABC-type nitrate/sulfonate/bicarbonate transport system substrate-binding protein
MTRCRRVSALDVQGYGADCQCHPGGAPPAPKRKQIPLDYCSQLLFGLPYEVARSAGYFENHGFDVQLVHSRGGVAAMQALVGGAVDYGDLSADPSDTTPLTFRGT